jgi:hypothetical protein
MGRTAACFAALVAALLIACGGGGDSADETPTPASEDATPTAGTRTPRVTPAGSATAPAGTAPAGGTPGATARTTPGSGSGSANNPKDAPVPSGADDAVRAAKEDIVDNIYDGRTVDEIFLVSIQPRDWPDACLGVPEQGEACATVITPGYEVVLDLDGAHYFYHTDEGTNVRLANFDLDPTS